MTPQADFIPTRPSPVQPDAVRAFVCHAAEKYGVEHYVDPTIRWAVIAWMESAWAEEKHKIREANRRACLRFMFGHDSTKLLADGTIAALRDWSHSAHNPGLPLAELRLLLRAALVEAGQAELELGE